MITFEESRKFKLQSSKIKLKVQTSKIKDQTSNFKLQRQKANEEPKDNEKDGGTAGNGRADYDASNSQCC
jgi:hypothetical protein